MVDSQVINYPFTNAQVELLRLFSKDLSDEDLLELRQYLSRFFSEKAKQSAAKVWLEKGWTDADVDKMLETRMRTPYNKPSNWKG